MEVADEGEEMIGNCRTTDDGMNRQKTVRILGRRARSDATTVKVSKGCRLGAGVRRVIFIFFSSRHLEVSCLRRVPRCRLEAGGINTSNGKLVHQRSMPIVRLMMER